MMENIFSRKYDSIAELRQELQTHLGHDFPLTKAEMPGELKADTECDISCASCSMFSCCMERGIPFMEAGCDHFEHNGFAEERMAIFNGIHLFLHGGTVAYLCEWGYDREFSSLDSIYRDFGHIRKPVYSVRRKPNRLEIILWDRQVIGTIPAA